MDIEAGIIYAFILALFLFAILELLTYRMLARDVSCMHDMMHNALHVIFGEHEEHTTVAEVMESANHEQVRNWDDQ